MRQVLIRAVSLAKRPFVALGLLTVAVGGSFLVTLPLFGVPGYELATAVAVGLGVLGGITGAAAAAQERRLIRGRDPRPKGAERHDSALVTALLAVGAATLLNLFAVVPPLVTAVAYALRTSPCSPWAHLGFYPLLTAPSALVSAAAGATCGFAARRGWGATLLYLMILLASAAWTLWPLYWGPQVFAYNPFGGFFPGPLYDEALAVHAPLWWARLETGLVAVFFVSFCACCLDMRDGALGLPQVRPAAVLLAAGSALVLAGFEDSAPLLGLRTTERSLGARLGGERTSPHFRVRFARGKAKEEVDRLVRDLEFRFGQLSTFLDGMPEGRVNVYVYRSPEEKQALVGASRTQFAKPWRLELHLNDAPFPSPALKHELAHVLLSRWGTGPFKLPTRWGVVPPMGLVEGAAVAADNPIDELTLHEWAAAMRKDGLAPKLSALFTPQGFYASAAPRAYTYAGSFLRYLVETYGAQKFQTLYAHGDFGAAYGRSLEALGAEWEKFLDQLPLRPNALHAAQARFHQEALFARPCAREVAQLAQEASEALSSNPAEALGLLERCARLQPDEPSFRLSQATALAALDRSAEAVQTLDLLAEREKNAPALLAGVRMAQADLFARLDRKKDAQDALDRVLALEPDQSLIRTAHVKLAALASRTVGRALWAYFTPGHDDVKLLVLREALASEPDNPYLLYLLGRRLEQGGSSALAVGYLTHSLQSELPNSLRKEALRLKLEGEYLSGDCAGVKNDLGHLPDFGDAYKASAREWSERCDFEAKAFQGPLVPAGPFR